MTSVAMDDMELAFRRDIIANPADDAPRLIFADWLEDHGRPERAQFIREQVELVGKWSGLCLKRPLATEEAEPLSICCRPCDLKISTNLILQVNGHWDCLPFPCYPLVYGLPHANPRFYRMFRRGFVHTVRCELNSWLTHGGPRIVREHPVECVLISNRRPVADPPKRNHRWYWRSPGSNELVLGDATLPVPIFNLLKNHPRCSYDSLWAMFESEQDALDALSTACLVHAKSINLQA